MSSKAQELAFHADRVKEATVRVLQAVALDPRVSPEEKMELLSQVSAVHVEMAEMIHGAIESGIRQGIAELSKVPQQMEEPEQDIELLEEEISGPVH